MTVQADREKSRLREEQRDDVKSEEDARDDRQGRHPDDRQGRHPDDHRNSHPDDHRDSHPDDHRDSHPDDHLLEDFSSPRDEDDEGRENRDSGIEKVSSMIRGTLNG
jgi:hypothetical protein